jgi:hypothetical protein
MNNSLKFWLGQVTTGHGFMILAPTTLAALTGTMSWTSAAPLLTAGVVGLIWPENTALQDASKSAASDIASLIAAARKRTG